MNLEIVKKEIEEKAKSHKYPANSRVPVTGFLGLVPQDFVDEAYYTLLGRNQKEAEKILKQIYSGQVDQCQWVQNILELEECKERNLDVNELRQDIELLQKDVEEREKLSFLKGIKRRVRMTLQIWFAKDYFKKINRVEQIWRDGE